MLSAWRPCVLMICPWVSRRSATLTDCFSNPPGLPRRSRTSPFMAPPRAVLAFFSFSDNDRAVSRLKLETVRVTIPPLVFSAMVIGKICSRFMVTVRGLCSSGRIKVSTTSVWVGPRNICDTFFRPKPLTATPSICVRRSPLRSPARAAGVFGKTSLSTGNPSLVR